MVGLHLGLQDRNCFASKKIHEGFSSRFGPLIGAFGADKSSKCSGSPAFGSREPAWEREA
jgi:hypothetical protein